MLLIFDENDSLVLDVVCVLLCNIYYYLSLIYHELIVLMTVRTLLLPNVVN